MRPLPQRHRHRHIRETSNQNRRAENGILRCPRQEYGSGHIVKNMPKHSGITLAMALSTLLAIPALAADNLRSRCRAGTSSARGKSNPSRFRTCPQIAPLPRCPVGARRSKSRRGCCRLARSSSSARATAKAAYWQAIPQMNRLPARISRCACSNRSSPGSASTARGNSTASPVPTTRSFREIRPFHARCSCSRICAALQGAQAVLGRPGSRRL